MISVVDCPSCSRSLRVPDELWGKQVKCPTCGVMFTAKAASEPASATVTMDSATPHLNPEKEPISEEHADPEDRSHPSKEDQIEEKGEEYRFCPQCDEKIRVEAMRCRFCGTDLEEDGKSNREPAVRRVRRDWESHRGVLVLVLGILSIIFLVVGVFPGIAAWVMGGADLKKMAKNAMDPEGKGLTQAGWVCGIIGTIVQFLMTLACIGYIAFFIVYLVPAMGKAGPGFKPVGTVRKAPQNQRFQDPPAMDMNDDDEDP